MASGGQGGGGELKAVTSPALAYNSGIDSSTDQPHYDLVNQQLENLVSRLKLIDEALGGVLERHFGPQLATGSAGTQQGETPPKPLSMLAKVGQTLVRTFETVNDIDSKIYRLQTL